jgi:hypothetical protein
MPPITRDVRGDEFQLLRVSIPHVDVLACRRKSGYVLWCAVTRFGWMEKTLRNGEVVAADAEGILSDDASQLVLLDPLQGGAAILEHAGRKLCRLAVEDPDLWRVDIDFGIVFMHVNNVYQPTCRGLDQACSFAADKACSWPRTETEMVNPWSAQ